MQNIPGRKLEIQVADWAGCIGFRKLVKFLELCFSVNLEFLSKISIATIAAVLNLKNENLRFSIEGLDFLFRKHLWKLKSLTS